MKIIYLNKKIKTIKRVDFRSKLILFSGQTSKKYKEELGVCRESGGVYKKMKVAYHLFYVVLCPVSL
jgi:hypothetical protein